MSRQINLARVYGEIPDEGLVILVDRLWPRGISRNDWPDDTWRPDLAPTSDLRQWLHEDPDARFDEFAERYRAQLDDNAALDPLLGTDEPITFVTAAKDPERSHLAVLRDYLLDSGS